MSDLVVVGIADMQITKPPNKLISYGLGSCVGVVLYNPKFDIAGMVHIMLPSRSNTYREGVNIYKYADSGVKALIDIMTNEKDILPLSAKITGGATIFPQSGENIGDRNIKAVKQVLQENNIPIISEDIGGDYGRTITFDIETFKLTIKSPKRDLTII